MPGIWTKVMWIATVSLAVQIGLVKIAAAQEPEPEVVTRVIKLHAIDIHTAKKLLEEVYMGELHAITGSLYTGHLIVRGYESDVEAAEELLLEIDVPGEEREQLSTYFIDIQSYPLKKLMPLLMTGHGPQIAADFVNQKIIVYGTAREFAEVEEFISAIDQPTQPLRLQFYFLLAKIGASGKSDLPKALEPVAKTLAASGFGELSMMAPVFVRADSGEDFEQSFKSQPPRGTDNTQTLDFDISGSAQTQAGGKLVSMELSARMYGSSSSRGRVPEDQATFSMSTTLSVALNQYVVLAAAPSSTRQGDAVVLVVHVSRADGTE